MQSGRAQIEFNRRDDALHAESMVYLTLGILGDTVIMGKRFRAVLLERKFDRLDRRGSEDRRNHRESKPSKVKEVHQISQKISSK